MAPQPKRKHSQTRGRVRAMALRMATATLTPCPSCKRLRTPHKVCPFCGYYDNRTVVMIKEKKGLQAGRQAKDENAK